MNRTRVKLFKDLIGLSGEDQANTWLAQFDGWHESSFMVLSTRLFYMSGQTMILITYKDFKNEHKVTAGAQPEVLL